MTLHEAIKKLLVQSNQPMTTQQIADELNNNGWYKKKDGSPIMPYQIHGRTKNYTKLFDREGSSVSLAKESLDTYRSQPIVNTGKSHPLQLFFGIFIASIGVYCFFTSSNKLGSLKTEACIISEGFVEQQLLSPKSADFGYCDASKIIHLGNNRYKVTNYVDASNAFGAVLRKNYVVIVRFTNGDETDSNNWALENIEIE